MAQGPKDIEFPEIRLKHCTTQEHCESLRACGDLPFWWYQGTSRLGRNFSLPFQDNLGHWWYQVRPGFAWPVDALDPVSSVGRRVPLGGSFLAYQYVVSEGEASNSTLVINTITELSGYGAHSIDDKRRNAVRKGLRSCDVIAVDRVEDGWLNGVTKAWNDLVERTGWKTHRDAAAVRDSWSRLLELPSASVLLAVEKTAGQVAGFLITKVYGRTAYVDTIASNSDLLGSNPNDVLMYTFIRNVQQLADVSMMHYAIKSDVEHLEKFKTSLGFVPHPFPAALHTRPGMMTALRVFRPKMYKRLTGLR